jgi:hypothetical protein
MHAVYAAKHSRESPLFTFLDEAVDILFSWRSQIVSTKCIDDCSTEMLQGLLSCRGTDTHILIDRIGW